MDEREKKHLPINIVGAGIGGLTLALQLYDHGFHNVRIFETVRDPKPLGGGVNLQPSAVLVLRNLGLLPTLEKIGIETREQIFFNQYGQQILGDRKGRAAGYEVPQLSIARGNLQMRLLEKVKERLGHDSLVFGHRFESLREGQSGISATFRTRLSSDKFDGQRKEVTSAVLVGADGINSAIRSIFYPNEGEPKFSGRLLWRGSFERAPVISGSTFTISGFARKFFVAYAIENISSAPNLQSIYWVCCLPTQSEDDPNTSPPEKAIWTIEADRNRFVEEFRSWTLPDVDIAELVNQTDTVWEYPMCDRDPVERWSFGGMGATQAILDCASLAKHLEAHEDAETAFKAYEGERLEPTSKIVLSNRGKTNNEYVMEMVHERAPNGFRDIHDVISKEELEAVGAEYRISAGADKQKVNEMAKATEHLSERYRAHGARM